MRKCVLVELQRYGQISFNEEIISMTYESDQSCQLKGFQRELKKDDVEKIIKGFQASRIIQKEQQSYVAANMSYSSRKIKIQVASKLIQRLTGLRLLPQAKRAQVHATRLTYPEFHKVGSSQFSRPDCHLSRASRTTTTQTLESKAAFHWS